MSELLAFQKDQIAIPQFSFPTIFQVVSNDMQDYKQKVQSFCENRYQVRDKKTSLDFDHFIDQHQYPNSRQQDEFLQEGVINILIYSNDDEECKQFLEKLIIKLCKEEYNIFIDDQLFNQNQHFLNKSQYILKSNQFQFISFIIILGGDGTILQALNQLQNQTIPPILAFQIGSNGFICQFEKNNMDGIIEDQINHFRINGRFNTTKRIRIEGILRQRNLIKFKYHALNEFVVSRGSNPHCLFIEIYLNNILLTISSGDGIIISTPTGSTGYFVSAGGPIIQSDVQSISIIPICPLSLSFRPIVLQHILKREFNYVINTLPPCITITIKLSNICRSNGFISADGQETLEFSKDMIFEIKNSYYGIELIQKDQTYYRDWIDSLRNKLQIFQVLLIIFWNTIITE